MITAKHFQKIADMIKPLSNVAAGSHYITPESRDWIAREFARMLAGENPRFDSARFLRACGVDDNA